MKRILFSFLFVAFLHGCSDQITHEDWNDIKTGFSDTIPTQSDGVTATDSGPTDTSITVQNYKLGFELAAGDDDISCASTNHCTIFLSYNEERSLEVVYTGDGSPIASQLVQFSIENDPKDLGKLSTFSSYTNGEGVAGVQVQPKQSAPGSFTVKAMAEGAAPLYFDVQITPKGTVPLTVLAKYTGNRPLTTYNVRLYLTNDSAPNCDDLNKLYNEETAHQQSPATNLTQSVKFTQFPGLENDGAQHYTILVYALNELGAVLAWGCNAADGEVKYGYSTTVIVDLLDVPPKYKGTYEVTSYFDFVSALPDEAEPYVNILLDFFGSPVEAILNLTCTLGGNVLGEFCDFLFDASGNPTFTGELVMDFLDTILAATTKDTIWGTIMTSGGDIASMLQQFEMGAIITFKDEPDDKGIWTEDLTEENWDKVVVKWSLDANCDPFLDEDCGKMQFSLGAIDQQGTITGSFIASVANDWELTIDDHPINLKYGALLNHVIEKMLLPMMTGWEPGKAYKVDSYEELFQYLLAGDECLTPGFPKSCCAVFAEDVAAQAGNLAQGLLESTCDLLTDMGAAYIRNALLDLDIDTGDGFTIGTAQPCIFYDANEDMVVDGFGTAADMCTWKASIDFGFAQTAIEGKFFATRLD
jgi:hypothetical protein